MAGDCDPIRPPQEKRPANPFPSTTSIDSLSDDIILDIFLRLPSLTALIRAAFARRAWSRAVASSPSFRRRFRARHPAPLLGLFFSPTIHNLVNTVPIFPTFAPSRCPDRDLAGVVRTGDFFLTCIQARTGAAPQWDIVDCRGGLVLLGDWSSDANSYALLNPSTRRIHGFFDIPWDILEHHCGFSPILHGTQLICSDGDPMSFRIICIAHDDSSMVRAAVFSSDTREWSVLPWVEVSPRPRCDNLCRDVGSKCEYICLEEVMQDSGSFIYCPFKNRESFLKLDTTTMEFSVAQLPSRLRNQNSIHSFVFGETKDGLPCIVYAEAFNIGVLVHNADSDSEGWVLDRLHSLKEQLGRFLGYLLDHVSRLNVVEIRNGYAYLKTIHHDPETPYWFLSLCLERMELEKVFQQKDDSDMCPCIMPWPTCLAGDYGRFAGEAAL